MKDFLKWLEIVLLVAVVCLDIIEIAVSIRDIIEEKKFEGKYADADLADDGEPETGADDGADGAAPDAEPQGAE